MPNLPHPNVIKNYFGTTDSSGELHESENIINSVFSKPIDKKYSKIRVDEK